VEVKGKEFLPREKRNPVWKDIPKSQASIREKGPLEKDRLLRGIRTNGDFWGRDFLGEKKNIDVGGGAEEWV